MSEKRKDNKGRILRTGESQRKDLIYQYRYTDIRGKRQTIYSSDSLLERYISLKQGVRYNTKAGYNFVLNLVKKEDFGYRQIRDIKVSDAQQWIMKLHPDKPLPHITPHVFRHTFCTNMASAGMDIKNLQYPS